MINRRLFETTLKENLVKNFLVILLAFLFYKTIFLGLKVVNSNNIGDFLLIVSILLVTVCFANFAFSYEHSNIRNFGIRTLSHASTFIFMLLIALLLEALVISINFVYPKLLGLMTVFSLLLYTGVALYDFWDFFRVFKEV
jgi:hypothetical protein